MEIIDNTKPKPPRFIFENWLKTVPSAGASQVDIERFWRKEQEYWVTGRGGLPGAHYSYLTVGTIKTTKGQSIKPRWRDFDEFIISEDSKAAKLGKNTIIVKRREFGLSSFFGGHMPIHTGLIHPGSTSLLTSADKPRVENLFAEKVMTAYNGLNDYIRPGRISVRSGGYLHMGHENKRTKIIEGVDSKVICRETADTDKNAMAFENYRAMYIFLDELFRHDRASQVLTSSQACLRQGFTTEGHMVLGGSCGNMSAEGAREGENLWNDATNLDMATIFIPGYACIESADELDDNGLKTGNKLNFCVNGHSDEKSATEWILKTRDRLSKLRDKKHYESFVVEYPLSIEEVFNANTSGLLGENINQKIKESERKIREGEYKEAQYNIRRENGRVIAEPHTNGKFYIFIPPNPNGEYIAGCDPIPFGNAQIDKGSDFAVVIKDRYSERYCAYYAERNLIPEVVAENTMLLQELYKSAKYPTGALMNVEMNRGEILHEKYKQAGKLHLLSNRLVNLGIAYESSHNIKGWHNNNKTGARANSYLIEYLNKYADQIGLKRILDELKKWPNANLDVVDAMLSCEMLDQELSLTFEKVYSPPPKIKRRVITRDSSGRTIIKWV